MEIYFHKLIIDGQTAIFSEIGNDFSEILYILQLFENVSYRDRMMSAFFQIGRISVSIELEILQSQRGIDSEHSIVLYFHSYVIVID